MVMFPTNAVAKTVTHCPRRDQVVCHVMLSLYHAGPGRQIAFDVSALRVGVASRRRPREGMPVRSPTSLWRGNRLRAMQGLWPWNRTSGAKPARAARSMTAFRASKRAGERRYRIAGSGVPFTRIEHLQQVCLQDVNEQLRSQHRLALGIIDRDQLTRHRGLHDLL